MNQLTIRGFDRELEHRIRQLASREGVSLNRAVLKLLRRGAGLAEPDENTNIVGSSLDHLIGTWTDEEATAMVRNLDELGQIDAEMWR